MSFCLSKIEKLINKNHYVIEGIYIYENLCRYIKLISTHTGESMTIHIDPQYRFTMTKEEDERTSVLQNIDFSEGDTIIEKYKEYPDKRDLEPKYRKHVKVSEDADVELSEKLEEKYRCKIFLKDLEKPKISLVKSFFRQLQRLSLIVQDLRYRLCIFFKNYMFVTEQDDIVNCYIADKSVNHSINVVVDIEYFHKKIGVVQQDTSIIKKSLYTLINKNHSDCVENIKTLIQSLHTSFSTVDFIKVSQTEIENNLSKASGLLSTIQSQLDSFLVQYSQLDKSREDIYVHEKKRLENKIRDSESVKQKLLNYILSIYDMKDKLVLTLDQVEFDISIFLDGIRKRIEEFNSLKK